MGSGGTRAGSGVTRASKILKISIFHEKSIFFFRSGGPPGLLREYPGLLRSETSMNKLQNYDEKKTCSRKAIKIPYFGDQKCHAWNLQSPCRIQKIKKLKKSFFYKIFGGGGMLRARVRPGLGGSSTSSSIA